MKLRRRRMPVLQPPKARLYILCLFLAAGILAGFLAGRTVASEDLLSLSRYVTGYARLNAEEPRSAGLWQVLWTYLRYPAAAFLLGCTAWGVMLIPLTCAAQGFFLSFAVQCFAAALGKQGVVLALAALGLRCLFTIPCLLTIAADSFACAWCRAERQKAGGERPAERDHLCVCIADRDSGGVRPGAAAFCMADARLDLKERGVRDT